MTKNCKKTCCSNSGGNNGTNSGGNNGTNSGGNNGTNSGGNNGTSGFDCSACTNTKDNNKNCHGWGAAGYCVGKYNKFMKGSCLKSCCEYECGGSSNGGNTGNNGSNGNTGNANCSDCSAATNS
mmetsp:Transcript_77798/g.117040  ORF Transcript_77798/g.117040 Transcript_77798/m.117040 type:complete len:124 (-) Transcript_77798:191-562(-)